MEKIYVVGILAFAFLLWFELSRKNDSGFWFTRLVLYNWMWWAAVLARVYLIWLLIYYLFFK